MRKACATCLYWLSAHQHLLVILLSLFLLGSSGWIFMGRVLGDKASVWDHLHVYLGLIAAGLSLSMLLDNVRQGRWRQYFPWLRGDVRQLSADFCGLMQGKLPQAGGRGLFSVIEGIGLLLFCLVSLTGIMWFVTQGSHEALSWRSYHHSAAHGFIGFMLLHALCAAAHLLDFVRQ